jgi:rRNA pseudouridine-1189 N-methylase Emg1 (Nep1/Mra1 family)
VYGIEAQMKELGAKTSFSTFSSTNLVVVCFIQFPKHEKKKQTHDFRSS